jgi:hypothetical protein
MRKHDQVTINMNQEVTNSPAAMRLSALSHPKICKAALSKPRIVKMTGRTKYAVVYIEL